MLLENRLNITDQIELAKQEEKISKQKAKQLFDSGQIKNIEVGTFAGLAAIIYERDRCELFLRRI